VSFYIDAINRNNRMRHVSETAHQRVKESGREGKGDMTSDRDCVGNIFDTNQVLTKSIAQALLLPGTGQ